MPHLHKGMCNARNVARDHLELFNTSGSIYWLHRTSLNAMTEGSVCYSVVPALYINNPNMWNVLYEMAEGQVSWTDNITSV